MKIDAEGFSYPQVDTAGCIHCGLCERTCPVVNTPALSVKTNTLAVQSKDEENRGLSTAGGFFFEAAKHIIEIGGYVCAVGFGENARVEHKIVNSIAELEELRGSKYVQSNITGVFSEIRKLLNEGKTVLFAGTPCQAAGLKKFIGSIQRGQLYIIDLICYGVPSPLIYNKWIEEIQNKYKKRVKHVAFRDKSFGYAAPNVKIIFEDGGEIEQTSVVKSYMKFFMADISVRPSCTACRFKTIEKCSDITIGDCWHVSNHDKNMDDNKGATNVFIHTANGKKLVDAIKEHFTFVEVDTEYAVRLDGKKMLTCVSEVPYRDTFFNDAVRMSYVELSKKYVPDRMKDYLVMSTKRIMKGLPGFQIFLKFLRR